MANFQFVFPLDPDCFEVECFTTALLEMPEGPDDPDINASNAMQRFKDHHQARCPQCRTYGVRNMKVIDAVPDMQATV
jgi:hypothetical protein